MDLIKKIWFHSFKVEKKNVASLVVNLIIWVIATVLAGLVLWLAAALTGWIPFIGGLIGAIVGLIGGVIEIYSVVGIVLSVLNFLDALKS